MAEEIKLTPQPGPQHTFLTTEADIAIYGGSAGSGKSYALLIDPLRHVRHNPHYAGVIFRRTTPEIRNPGALWDESMKVYGVMEDAEPKSSILEWQFRGYPKSAPGGGKIKFAHLEYDTTAHDWHGSQVPFFGFDELTTFTQYQFFYLLSRNRSATAGVKPYIRATCNPDADSWVAELISWWINQETGFPIPERSGVLRWFVRVGDKLVWADHPSLLRPELIGAPTHTPRGEKIEYLPKSLTFIAATISDNPALLKGDPNYLANLMALPTVERERLLRGNWKIRPASGLFFRREWCEVVDLWQIPENLRIKRGWDLAGTAKTHSNDPDWTCGTKGGKTTDGSGVYYVLDHFAMQGTPGQVELAIKNIASQDGRDCEVWLPQDPGQAGKSQVLNYVKVLDGYTVKYSTESVGAYATATGKKTQAGHAKEVRFGPFSSRAEAGLVKVLRGPWNERWFSQLEGFPDLSHDDDVDSTARWFNSYLDATTGLIEYYQQQAMEEQKRIAETRFPPVVTSENGVRVRPPPTISSNILYDLRGNPIFVDDEGCFLVEEKHADMLRRSGFTRVD